MLTSMVSWENLPVPRHLVGVSPSELCLASVAATVECPHPCRQTPSCLQLKKTALKRETFKHKNDLRLTQDLPHSLVVEGQDALKDQDIGSIHGGRLLFASVGHKVVDGNVHLLSLFQPLQSFFQEWEVESFRVVEVVLVSCCCFVLFL